MARDLGRAMCEAIAMRPIPLDWREATPAVCPGCGCTEADACLTVWGYTALHERVEAGCRWVETGDGWRCSACVWPEDKVRGPTVDHRAPGQTGEES